MIKGWSLSQMDVSNAFFHSELDEEIHMTLPQGYTSASCVILSNHVWRLHKSIYGVKPPVSGTIACLMSRYNLVSHNLLWITTSL